MGAWQATVLLERSLSSHLLLVYCSHAGDMAEASLRDLVADFCLALTSREVQTMSTDCYTSPIA